MHTDELDCVKCLPGEIKYSSEIYGYCINYPFIYRKLLDNFAKVHKILFMELKSNKIPHSFFPLYQFIFFLQLSNTKNKEKLAKYLIKRLEEKVSFLQDDYSGSIFLDSCIQFLLYLQSFSDVSETDPDDTYMYFAPNFVQYWDDDETWEPQLSLTQKLIMDEALSLANAYIIENKLLNGTNPSGGDGLITEWKKKPDSLLTMFIVLYLIGELYAEDSEIKYHREGTKRDNGIFRRKNQERPTIYTFLANHFCITEKPYHPTTIYRHCEKIFDDLLRIINEVKSKIRGSKIEKTHICSLEYYKYFLQNRNQFIYSKRIDLDIMEFICSLP